MFDDDFTPLEQSEPPVPVEPEYEPEPDPTTLQSSTFANPRGQSIPRGPRRGGAPKRNPAPPREQPAEPTDAPTEDGAAQQPRPERREAAVRGDRSGTGGPKREKLTEEELSAKLDAMKLKNATLMEKHARSQADEESFYAREAQAAVKRKEERQNRQQMMGERERNRLRKLQAQGGREWDMEKNEKEFASQDGRKARRGAFGGVGGEKTASSPPPPDAEDSSDRRGGFRGRGRGRGRGAFNRDDRPQPQRSTKQQKETAPPTSADFPELPAAVKSAAGSEPSAPKTLEFPGKKKTEGTVVSPVAEKQSWADQMEGP